MTSKKIIVILVSVIIIAATVVAAIIFLNKDEKKTVTVSTTKTNSKGEEQTQTKVTEVSKATDIESALAAWKAAGLTVSDDEGAYYQMVDASNGGKYDVNGTNVEIYEFSDKAKANDAKNNYFTSDADTIFVTGTLLVDIHSTDTAEIAPIEAVF